MGDYKTRVHRRQGTVKPWNSTDSFRPREYKYEPIHKPDLQEEIDMCVNCPLPAKKCFGNGGCYIKDGMAKKSRKNRGAYDAGEYKKMRELGCTDDQVAAAFGVTRKTAAKWRREYTKRLNNE